MACKLLQTQNRLVLMGRRMNSPTTTVVICQRRSVRPTGECFWESEIAKIWETAVTQSANSDFIGSKVYFYWENSTTGLWDTGEKSRTITLSTGPVKVKSKCYVCCDPSFMATNKRCMPTISGAVAYSWCATPKLLCQRFYACAEFSNTSRHISAVLANAQLLILGIFYCLQALMCLSIYFGVKRFEEKYEEDFEGQNMSFWDGLCGFFC